MSPKRNVSTRKPLSLDDQAVQLHDLIAGAEDGAAPLYFQLGAVLKAIKEEQQCDWKGLMTYATDPDHLNLRRSRVVRAHRIHTLYESKPEEVNGLTVYEALQHKPTSKTTPQPLGAPLTRQEYSAARRLITLVGDKERAREVLQLVLEGKEPVKSVKKKVEKTWLPAWEEIRDNRDELRKRVGGNQELHNAWESLPVKSRAIPTYQEVKADPTACLNRFRKILAKCHSILEKKHLKTAATHHAKVVKIVGGVQQQVNDALDTSLAESVTTESVTTESVTTESVEQVVQ